MPLEEWSSTCSTEGRYKCFPVETEGYFYQVVRYVKQLKLESTLRPRGRPKKER
jgi:hypothetical protein